MTLSSEEEAKAALVASNTRCHALESKLGNMAMEHRSAQRKMAKELDVRVRGMDSLRSGVEAELRSLNARNRRLRAALEATCDAARGAGVEPPLAAVAELSAEDQGHAPASPLTSSTDAALAAAADKQLSVGGQERPGRAKESPRSSRSPSPFRRFMGKRATSPTRAESAAEPPPPPAPPGGAVIGVAFQRAPNPAPFRRWSGSQAEKPASPALQRPAEGSGDAMHVKCREGTRPSTPTSRESAAAAMTPVATAKEGGVADLLQDRRNASRDAAAQKHQARLRAVRTSSRGKWGFSV